MRVLYLEDDSHDIKFMSLYFATTAHVLACVSTIEEAEQALAGEEDFDVLFIDIVLSHSREGYRFIEALRHRGIQQPIVAVTALATSQDRENILSSGATRILQKPFRITDLAQLVESLHSSL